MATPRFTLTSYDPVYVIAPEIRIPESAVKEQALRWLELNVCKGDEKPRLTDQWVNAHTKDFKTVDELLIFVRYNMYRDNREAQELADQDAICKELSTRLVEDIPEDIVEEAVYAANLRFEDMLLHSGMSAEDFCKEHNMSLDQAYADVEERTIQSLKEDSALEAYAQYRDYTLEADDFYAIIPGDSIQDKAYKRQQIELEGRLAQMEEYALKTKALKEVMANAMIKRSEYDEEWLRYGDTNPEVVKASNQYPDNFVGL